MMKFLFESSGLKRILTGETLITLIHYKPVFVRHSHDLGSFYEILDCACNLL